MKKDNWTIKIIIMAFIISFVLVISFTVTTYIIAMKYGSKNIERIE